jgi:hypothetical protein
MKAEGIVQKVAWHWGSNSSVINDPLGEAGHLPLYEGLLFVWGSMGGAVPPPLCFVEELVNWGLTEI